MAPGEGTVTTPRPWYLNPGLSEGSPEKPLKFKLVSKILRNQEKLTQGHQQTTKRDPNLSLMLPNYCISRKVKSFKTYVVTMVTVHAAIAFWHHSHPWITKGVDRKLLMHSYGDLIWKQFELVNVI